MMTATVVGSMVFWARKGCEGHCSVLTCEMTNMSFRRVAVVVGGFGLPVFGAAADEAVVVPVAV